jgi:hypothetical protein
VRSNTSGAVLYAHEIVSLALQENNFTDMELPGGIKQATFPSFSVMWAPTEEAIRSHFDAFGEMDGLPHFVAPHSAGWAVAGVYRYPVEGSEEDLLATTVYILAVVFPEIDELRPYLDAFVRRSE